jgi:hypothetical protein
MTCEAMRGLEPMPVRLRVALLSGHPSRRPLRTLRHGAKRARLLRSGLLRVSGIFFMQQCFPAHPEEAPSFQAPSRRMRS